MLRDSSVFIHLLLLTALLSTSPLHCSSEPEYVPVFIYNNTTACENGGYSIDLSIDKEPVGVVAPGQNLQIYIEEGCHQFSSTCSATGVFRSVTEKCLDRHENTFTLSGYCDTCPSDFEFEVMLYNDTDDCEEGGYPMAIMVDGEPLDDLLSPGDSITVSVEEGKHCFRSLCIDGSFRSETCPYIDESSSPIHFLGYCDRCSPF